MDVSTLLYIDKYLRIKGSKTSGTIISVGVMLSCESAYWPLLHLADLTSFKVIVSRIKSGIVANPRSAAISLTASS